MWGRSWIKWKIVFRPVWENPRQSWILDSRHWIPGTGFQSLSVGFGFWIPISSRIPGSWAVFWFPQTNISRILESKFPYMYPAKQKNFVVPSIWTLNLTESRGESKNDSKGEAFMMAAAINVPRGRSFVQKKKKKNMPALQSSLHRVMCS